MHFEWYHWAVLGIALIAFELVIPGLVLIWFGLGGLLVAILLVMLPEIGLTSQLLIWMAASIASVVWWFKVVKPHADKTRAGRSSAEAIGEVGLLVNDLEPFGKAKVRFQTPLIGSDVWECIADEKIQAGSRVKVVSVEGSLLKVTRA